MLFEQCANMARCDNDSNDYLILLWKIYRASLPISLSLQYAGSSQISGDKTTLNDVYVQGLAKKALSRLQEFSTFD